jgi:quinol monooxygenase YgiN
MSEVVVVAVLTVKEGEADRAIAGFTPVIEQTHGESGCISYALHRDNNDPNTVVLIERWRSQEDLDAHFTMPYMGEMGALAAEVLAEPPRIVFCSPVPIGNPVKGIL